jgi:hypothetical protein
MSENNPSPFKSMSASNRSIVENAPERSGLRAAFGREAPSVLALLQESGAGVLSS